MHVADHSSCQDSFFENLKIDSDPCHVRDYYWQIVRRRLSYADSSLIFQALQEIFSFYRGKFRESGVVAVEHPVEVALLLLGEWIPYALHSSQKAGEWVLASCDEREYLQRQSLSKIMDVADDDRFARYFSLIPSRAFSRMRDSFASCNALAHLLALLHDRIEDDPRILNGSVLPEALISKVTEAYSSYTEALVEPLRSISYFNTRRHGGDPYTKADYIRAMFFASPIALLIKGLDVFSNVITIRDLQDKVFNGGVRRAAERQKDKLAEYSLYADRLIDTGHPFADLLADVLYALSSPEEFQHNYRLYGANSFLYREHIDTLFTHLKALVGQERRCRLDLGGVYRAVRRFQRGFYGQDLRAAFAPRFIIHAQSVEDKNAIVYLLCSSFFGSLSSCKSGNTEYILHQKSGYTEMLVPMPSGYSLLFLVTDPDSAWKFSALEESLFSSDPFDVRTRDLLHQYLRAYALSLPEDAEASLEQLRLEPIRDLIQVTVCVNSQDFVVFLPADSCVLDLSVRLCTALQRTRDSFSIDPSRLIVASAHTHSPLHFGSRVFHGSAYIVSFPDCPVDAGTLCQQLSDILSMDCIKTKPGYRWATEYLQTAHENVLLRRLVA